MQRIKLSVNVIPKASRNKVEQLGEQQYKVWVTAVPEDGKANAAVIKLLAKHLGVTKSQLEILSGANSRTKVIEVIVS